MGDNTLEVQLPSWLPSILGSYLRWWVQQCYENPVHLLVETGLIVLIVYILLKRPGKKKGKLETLPPQVVQELIDEYEPEPLCPDISPAAEKILEDYVILDEKPAKYTRVRGIDKKVLNLTTMDFCGLGQREEVQKAAHAALDKYGCGSCGPRGFYGTIDVHVFLEQDLAKFFGTEEAIVYSDASSTASSAIPAFSNRADLLVVDDGVNDSIMTGVNLSRSRTLFFKHNDMDDLKRVLQKVEEEDKRLQRKPQRRFIVAEGLYRNYGDIVPLDELFKLKRQYRWRVFLDESHSIGTFGATGRGVHEHFGIPIQEIDLVVSSLSTTLASVGGFCVGSREVVEHQRLAAAGYCFSASSPPFVSTAGSAAIKVLDSEAKQGLTPAVKKKSQYLHGEINKLGKGFLVPVSNPMSPLLHVRIDPKFRAAAAREDYTPEARLKEETILRTICAQLRQEGFLATTANYLINPQASKTIGGTPRPAVPPPSIRLAITSVHEESELESFCAALCKIAKETLQNYQADADAATTTTTTSEGLKKRK